MLTMVTTFGELLKPQSFQNVKYIQYFPFGKIRVADHNHFYRVLKGTGCLQSCAKQKHLDVCGQLSHSSARYAILWNVGVLSTKLHKYDAFQED
jgi:hypothetical protein